MPPKIRTSRTSRRTANPPTPEETTEQIIARRVAEAIAQYEASRNRSDRITLNRSETGNPPNEINPPADKGCSYKTFIACKPNIFKGTEGAIGIIYWVEKLESVFAMSGCSRGNRVTYATGTLTDQALTWWNAQVQALGLDTANAMPWEDFKTILLEEFCPQSELQEVETELWNIKMVGADITGYTTRFHELARLVPHMVTPEKKRIERYVKGLAPQIRSMVTSAAPSTFRSAVTLAQNLTQEAVQMGTLTKKAATGRSEPSNSGTENSGDKRKWISEGNDRRGQHDRWNFDNNRAYTATMAEPKTYLGNKPKCRKCRRHHDGECNYCNGCKRWGHLTQTCRANPPLNADNDRQNWTCFECGDPNHFLNQCPRLNNHNNNRNNYNTHEPARGRMLLIEAREAHQDPNTNPGTFLVNKHFCLCDYLIGMPI